MLLGFDHTRWASSALALVTLDEHGARPIGSAPRHAATLVLAGDQTTLSRRCAHWRCGWLVAEHDTSHRLVVRMIRSLGMSTDQVAAGLRSRPDPPPSGTPVQSISRCTLASVTPRNRSSRTVSWGTRISSTLLARAVDEAAWDDDRAVDDAAARPRELQMERIDWQERHQDHAGDGSKIASAAAENASCPQHDAAIAGKRYGSPIVDTPCGIARQEHAGKAAQLRHGKTGDARRDSTFPRDGRRPARCFSIP